MKSKRVLTILLSLAIMLTFMPTLALAAVADDDVTCTYTVAGTTQTKTTTSIAEAIASVNDGGTITVTGTINHMYNIGENIDFTIDASGATIAEGAGFEPDNWWNCLVADGQVYSYHEYHDIDSADAVPVEGKPNYALVTISCKHGHEELLQDEYEGEYVRQTETKITYGTTILGFDVEWTVDKDAVPTTYELVPETQNYIQDRTGKAVKDDSGKVQFYANYYIVKPGSKEIAVDDNGDAIALPGAIVGEPYGGEPATEDAWGYHSYKVSFTFPDGSKAKSVVDGETVEYLVIDNVIDEEPLGQEKGNIVGIAFQYAAADGTVEWVDAAGANLPVVYEGKNLVLGNDGSLTYSIKYHDKNGAPESYIYGDAETLAAKSSTVLGCGATTYAYNTVSKTYTPEGSSDIKTFKFTPSVSVEGTHAYADRATWAEQFRVIENPSHTTEGKANVKCKYCDKYDSTYQPTGITANYDIPTTDHSFVKEGSADKVVTVAATCQHPGFQYKICKSSDGKWVDGKYKLDFAEKGSYTFDDPSKFTIDGVLGHPVVVEGSVTSKTDHRYFVTTAEIKWGTDIEGSESAANCEFGRRCMYEAEDITCVYHQLSLAEAKAEGLFADDNYDAGSVNTVTKGNTVHVFGAIDDHITEGADCSKANTITYEVVGVSKLDESKITTTKTSELTFGPHTYKNAATFSKDGKTAKVIQQCTNSNCAKKPDAEGKGAVRSDDAVVTSVDNADGTTTYTAKYGNEVLGTKTLFDLTKAVVTVNGGEVLDVNTIPFDEDAYDEADEYATTVADEAQLENQREAQAANENIKIVDEDQGWWQVQVVVYDATTGEEFYRSATVNRYQQQSTYNQYRATGTEIRNEKGSAAAKEITDAFSWQATYDNAFAEKYAVLTDSNAIADYTVVTINGAVVDPSLYSVVISAPHPGKLVEGTNKVVVTADPDSDKIAGTASGVVKCVTPGTLYTMGALIDGKEFDWDPYTFDGKAHAFEAEAVYNGDNLKVEGASVSYAVLTYDEWDAGDYDPTKLSYGKAEITEAGKYVVLAKVEKEGYTTNYGDFVCVVTVNKVETGATITVDAQLMKYGDELVVTTGDAELDKTIGLSAEKASKKGVGEYLLKDLVTFDPNYDVAVERVYVTIEKRNATVVLKNVTKTYDGKAIDPATLYTVDGVVNGDDLNVIVNTEGDSKVATAPGTYKLIATANNANYNIEVVPATLKINKLANTMKVSAKTLKAKSKKKVSKKVITVSNAVGTVTYAKASGNKKIKVNKKTGKITVKKGLKKGKYTVTVNVTAAGNATTAALTVPVTVKVKVK